MKKIIPLILLSIFFVSCEHVLKNRGNAAEVVPEKKVELGNDKDEQGCVVSAGYKWSLLRKECIRVVDEGYRLNPLEELKEEGTSLSAFIIFNEEKTVAELFTPNSDTSFLLSRKEDGVYSNEVWELEVNKAYTLKKNGNAMYAGALIEEKRITGDDSEGI